MGNTESNESNAAGSSGGGDPPRRPSKAAVAAAGLAAVGLGLGLAKLVSSNDDEKTTNVDEGTVLMVDSPCDRFPNENYSTYGINGKLISGRRKLKMNTDGSVKGDPARAGFGGVIRDENGCWVMGFYGRILAEYCTIEQAEIWGIYHGLKIIQDDQRFRDVAILSDSEAAINKIKRNKSHKSTLRKSPMDEIIEECNEMLQTTGCTLEHTPGKENKVADRLADLGRTQEANLVLLSSPPDKEIERLLEADARSASSE